MPAAWAGFCRRFRQTDDDALGRLARLNGVFCVEVAWNAGRDDECGDREKEADEVDVVERRGHSTADALKGAGVDRLAGTRVHHPIDDLGIGHDESCHAEIDECPEARGPDGLPDHPYE